MSSEIKKCQNCESEFVIEPEDFDFYEKIGVAPPTFCPDCRAKRRMVWRNERTLYRRKCDATQKNIISVFSEESPYVVYEHDYWWSDNWSAMDYGRQYDFSKPFFIQFQELLKAVPHNNVVVKNNVNSEHVNWFLESKDCYLSYGGGEGCERIYYSNRVYYTKDSLDVYFVHKVELSYQTSISQNAYQLFYSQNCDNCLNSYFLYDCRNCQNCFGCVGLRNKQYHIFNKSYSKNEYEAKVTALDLGSFKNVQKRRREFYEFKLKFPHKFANLVRAINTTGDNVTDAKNCAFIFDCVGGGRGSENSKFCCWAGDNMREVYDGTGAGVNSELTYENTSVVVSVHKVLFSVAIWTGYGIFYSFNCHNCNNLFGCIGLRNKSYCILNKQYTKEEYEELVPKIIKHMNEMPYISRKSEIRSTKSETNSNAQNSKSETREIIYRYGEFFPPELSLFAYNETIAQEYFPLTKDEAITQGYRWKDREERNYEIDIKTEALPVHIKDVQDDIIDKVIECANYKNPKSEARNPKQIPNSKFQIQNSESSNCTTAFKIIPDELAFYRRMNLPLPRLCPNCRHYERLKQRNPLKLWHRKCQCNGEKSQNNIYQNTITHAHGTNHCPNEFETSYAPDRSEIVYCEKCYQQEVV